MKIAVIGAGVTGVTSALELCADNHEVTVFDRGQTAAEGTSFANGGLVVPGWQALCGSPDGLPEVLRPGASSSGALRLGAWPSGATLGWLWRRHRARRNGPTQQAALFQLTRYSQERLAAVTDDLRLEHDRQQGVLLLWRTEREAELSLAALPRLRDWGLVARELDAATARQREPSLSEETMLQGALELPDATHANTRQFTLLLKHQAMQKGCRFEFGHTVDRIGESSAQGVTLLLSDGQSARFDQVVVCAGLASTRLLRPLGVDLPLQPVYAHSISAAIREPLDAPLSAVLDVRHQVSIARLGQRIRIAGGALLGGQRTQPSEAELKRLYRVLMDWFPGAARLGGPKGSMQEWVGGQATMPDGLPLVGQSTTARVWLNLGHGTSGWATACGCARALADQLGGHPTGIDMTPFAPTRPVR